MADLHIQITYLVMRVQLNIICLLHVAANQTRVIMISHVYFTAHLRQEIHNPFGGGGMGT
jgi:predicted HAD superfamily hydrolase